MWGVTIVVSIAVLCDQVAYKRNGTSDEERQVGALVSAVVRHLSMLHTPTTHAPLRGCVSPDG